MPSIFYVNLYRLHKIWYNIIALVDRNITKRNLKMEYAICHFKEVFMTAKKIKLIDIFQKTFWVWLGITLTLILIMFLIPSQKHLISGIIMASFFLVPVRDWVYRIITWAIDYVTSINTEKKDVINPKATYNRLINLKNRELNPGFYRTLRAVILLVTLLLALLSLIFSPVSYFIVYSWIHTIEFIIIGKISPIRILLYILLTLGYFYFMIRALGMFLDGKFYLEDGTFNKAKTKKALLIIGVFYAKIIISGWLLRFTFKMVFMYIIFWSVIMAIVWVFYKGYPKIVDLLSNFFETN